MHVGLGLSSAVVMVSGEVVFLAGMAAQQGLQGHCKTVKGRWR